jgi:two-component system NarL family response regulator
MSKFAGVSMTLPNIELTAREIQILSCMATGKPNKEIAKHLSISEATVENHLHSIFQKLGVKNRTQAALYAMKMSLIRSKGKNEK